MNRFKNIFNSTKSFTLQEIFDKVKSGEIQIEYNGHGPNDLKYMFNCEEEKIKSDLLSGDTSRIYDAKTSLKSKTKVGSFIRGTYVSSCQCFLCDERFTYVLKDEKTIAMAGEFFRFDFLEGKTLKEEYFTPCAGAELHNSKCLTSEINVPTGKIAVQNYFDSDEIYDLPKEIRYSNPTINCLLGRNRLMQYLAKKDVGYGQMGNMTINVYANQEEILIVDDYNSYMNPNKKLIKYLKRGNYKLLGEISLRVWRWMCADVSLLKKYGEEPKDIIADVTPGTYIVEHYVHALLEKDLPIWSRIKLKKP